MDIHENLKSSNTNGSTKINVLVDDHFFVYSRFHMTTLLKVIKVVFMIN